MFGNFDNWDNAEVTEDLFSEINNQEVSTDDTSAEEVVKRLTEETEETEDEQISQQEEDLFEKEEEENTDFSTDNEEEEVAGSNVAILKTLKEKGFLDFELEDETELTEELAEELIEDKLEETIEERIKEKMTGLPEEAQQILQYVLNGGSVGDYLNQVSNTSKGQLSEDLDLSLESNQALVVRELLAEEDFDEETIETQLSLLKESGKLESFATKKFEKWVEETKKIKNNLIKEQEQRKKEIKEAIRESKKKISETLNEVEEIGGLETSRDDKRVLPSYINDRTVKLQNGAEISQLQKELFYDLPKNEKAMIQLAILMRNRNQDGTFNFDNIAKKIQTNLTKDLKQNLRRSKSNVPKSGIKGSTKGKSLADYFK